MSLNIIKIKFWVVCGTAADALTLFEKFEQKLEQYEGDLKRATVELAKDWRMDKMLRHLDAMLVVMDKKNSFIIAGDGNVIEPDSQIVSIGSGGGYAQAAATAFLKSSTFSAKKIAQESLKIASGLCIYTMTQYRYRNHMKEMTPKQIVKQLDQYIIGQNSAKKSVAIALEIDGEGSR